MHIDAAILPVGKKSKKIKTKQNGAKAVKAFAVEIEEKPQPAKKGLKSNKLLESNKSGKEVDTAVRTKVEEGTKNIDADIQPIENKSRKRKSEQKIIYDGDVKADDGKIDKEARATVGNSQPAKKKLKSVKSSEKNAYGKKVATAESVEVEVGKKKKLRKQKKRKTIPNNEPNPDRQVLLIEECATYLKNWKENISNWKFNTRLQRWLIQSMLDDSCVSDDIFPIFLEYIAGAKGVAIEQVTERTKQAIENAEENETDADDPKLVRARALIQAVVVD